MSATTFIQEHTKLTRLPFLPELELFLAEEADALWRAVGAEQKDDDPPFPFWAFAWPGGQGMARYVLDNPESVKGKRILDFAAGSGLGAIAAALAGAKEVWAADCDPFAQEAIRLNAAQNRVNVRLMETDLQKPLRKIDVVLVGDVCYEHRMSHLVMKGLRLWAEEGLTVLQADPGRGYAPKEGFEKLAHYAVPTSRELEDQDSREVKVWRLYSP